MLILSLSSDLQNRLQFIFCDCEISIDDCIVVTAGERRPCVDPHGIAERNAIAFSQDDPNVNFTIPSFDSPCVPKISFRGAALIEFLSGNGLSPKESFGCGLAARVCFMAS